MSVGVRRYEPSLTAIRVLAPWFLRAHGFGFRLATPKTLGGQSGFAGRLLRVCPNRGPCCVANQPLPPAVDRRQAFGTGTVPLLMC